MLGLTHLLRIFHQESLGHLMLHPLIYYLLRLLLAQHLSLLALPLTIDQYLTYHYYLHRSLPVMLRMCCYPILFANHLYPRWRLVHYLLSLSLFVLLSLMLVLIDPLPLFLPVLLIHPLLFQLILCLLPFSLAQRLLPLALPLTIVLYLIHHYYLHHSPLVIQLMRYYPIL